MPDIYLYDDVPVLRNKLQVKNEKTLELIEAEQSRANMMLLYERGFHDFSPEGLCDIHRYLFGDIYDWAGQYRVINIEKRERLLSGRSVWYSNDENIARDLQAALPPPRKSNFTKGKRRLEMQYFKTAVPRRKAEQNGLVVYASVAIIKRKEPTIRIPLLATGYRLCV